MAVSPAVTPALNAEQKETSFKLGFFTQVPGTPEQKPAEVYAQLIDTVVAAEELGYESVWLGQHHFGLGNGQVPSPFVLLAAIAAKTSTIELGTAVTILPLADPIRLAEDVAVLHELSGGRVNLGIGTGGGDIGSFNAFGHSLEDRRQIFDDKLGLLHAALEGADLRSDQVGIHLHPPAAGVRQRIWHSVGSPERAALAGRVGDGILVGSFNDDPLVHQQPRIDAYLQAWQERQPTTKQPRIGTLRFTYAADSKETVEKQVEDELNRIREYIAIYNGDLSTKSTADSLAAVSRYGSVPDIIQSLLADPGISDRVTHFLPTVGLYPAAGASTPGACLDIERLRVMAEEIAPALGWQNPRA